MKKTKQVLAIIGIIILVGLYVSTLVSALSAKDNYMDLLMASVYATVVIPVLIWAYSFIYKLLKKHYHFGSDDETANDSGEPAERK